VNFLIRWENICYRATEVLLKNYERASFENINNWARFFNDGFTQIQAGKALACSDISHDFA
jgi:hypothetical protein